MKKILLYSIVLYQKYISPLTGSHCRFHPGCSEYARCSILSHGALKGIYLSLLRLVKCNPYHPGGYDPPLKQGVGK